MMSGGDVDNALYCATRAVIDTAVHTALQLTLSPTKSLLEMSKDTIVTLVAQEATRKIHSIFVQLLRRETWVLRSQEGLMESRMKSTRRRKKDKSAGRGRVQRPQNSGAIVQTPDHDPADPTVGSFEGHGEDDLSPFKNKVKTHKRLHTDTRPFTCCTCGKVPKTKSYLSAHQAVHNDKKPYQCSECRQSFKSRFSLRSYERIQTGDEPFKCSQCDKVFKQKRSLRLHESVHSGRSIICELCGASFTFQQNLKRHMRIHSGERPYKCQICGQSFVQNKLKAHMLNHGAPRTFMCDLCGRTFLYNFQLLRHQKQVHEKVNARDVRGAGRAGGQSRAGQRRVIVRRDKSTVDMTPLSCSTCHRCFQDTSALLKHQQIHSKKKHYECHLCDKAFFYKATYDYHLRLHSGERPFQCELCEKSFINHQSLKCHRLQHTGEKPHQCEHCGKAFRVRANYTKHLLIHSGHKPYECEVCHVRFRQLTHVQFHMQVHTGERPYSCSLCGLSFSDSRLLKKHSCGLQQNTELWTHLSH